MHGEVVKARRRVRAVRILFRGWVDRRPYDESRHLSSLQKRNSPVLKFAVQESIEILLPVHVWSILSRTMARLAFAMLGSGPPFR